MVVVVVDVNKLVCTAVISTDVGNYPFVGHLVVELEDRLVITNDRFKAQYVRSSLVHERTPAREDAILDASHDDFSGHHESFRRGVARWRVR